MLIQGLELVNGIKLVVIDGDGGDGVSCPIIFVFL